MTTKTLFPRLHPTARTVAVTSGKGGAGKTTTAVALAERLAANGQNVLLVDVDVPAPNVALTVELTDNRYATNSDTTEIVFPETRGFRVASPTFFTQTAGYEDMFELVLWANNVDTVIFDLPGGWTHAQETCVRKFVDVFVLCSPPTAVALADHKTQIGHIRTVHADRVKEIEASNKTRKNWGFPPLRMIAVETLASHTGTLPDGTIVDVRRLDAVPDVTVRAMLAEPGDNGGVVYGGSIPSAVNITALATTDQVGVLADLCTEKES